MAGSEESEASDSPLWMIFGIIFWGWVLILLLNWCSPQSVEQRRTAAEICKDQAVFNKKTINGNWVPSHCFDEKGERVDLDVVFPSE